MPQSRRPYSRRHLNFERALSLLYAGSWPAKLWALVPGSTRVTLLRHDVLARGRAAGRPPLKVAFASDLHLGPTTPRALLDNAFALLGTTSSSAPRRSASSSWRRASRA